ncbi:P-loop containing nucleoside triphosphate hydrolase [Vibrio phage 1.132.O._10N.222.49.F8]|nr:P-loop containing nucleoside triphosphate hydrolase [Vibrio phage 1.132.O._10N.222.49.F8]
MDNFNYEVELVSALMTGGATPSAVEVLGKIEPDMIHSGNIRNIYTAIQENYAQGYAFTPLEVSEKINTDMSSLVDLVRGSVGSAHAIKSYAKRVRQGFYLRKAHSELQGILGRIENIRGEHEIGEIHQQLENAISGLVIETDTKKPRVASEILDQYVDIVEERYKGGEEARRLRIGVDAIDEKTHGFNQTDLIILAGCPGMGKTELMMKFVNGASDENAGALVFSMEMDEYQLIERSVAIAGGIPLSAARSPQGMEQDDWSKFTMGMGIVKEKKFHVLDQAGLTVNEICAQATEHKMRHPETNLICIDYVGLIPLGKADRHDIALGEVSRKLKQLAKEIKTPVLLLAQVTSKSVESRVDKRPMASDIKDSSRLQDDADWIIFPYRDVVYNEDSYAKDIAEINFAKARHGTQGTVYMGWSNGHFVEVDQAMASHKCKPAQEQQSQKKGF